MVFYIILSISVLVIALGAWLFWALDRAPYPYVLHWLLSIPLPFLTNKRLINSLAPSSNERILEIGPGSGIQTVAIAPYIGAQGRLDIIDIQPSMLALTLARTKKKGMDWVVSTKCDAQKLPFTDNSFDGAYIVTTLGEIPDPVLALKELRRVIKPNGRLVIGEWTMDRHGISLSKLKDLATLSGFTLNSKQGHWWAYLAHLN